jgi:ABC-2 type transport system permease protein
MPWWLKILTNVTPAKFYLVVLRSVVLKGVGIRATWDQLAYLVLFSTVVIGLSVRRFRKTIG